MSRTVLTFTSPTFTVADTELGLATGDAYQCQLTRAQVVGTPSYSSIPATGCDGPAEVPSRSAWELQLAWLQDWTAADGGLSGYAFDHETELVWWKLEQAAGGPAMTGTAYVAAGAFGGDFGGAPSLAEATWKCPTKPTRSPVAP